MEFSLYFVLAFLVRWAGVLQSALLDGRLYVGFSLGSEGSCGVFVGFSKRGVQVSRDMGSAGFCM